MSIKRFFKIEWPSSVLESLYVSHAIPDYIHTVYINLSYKLVSQTLIWTTDTNYMIETKNNWKKFKIRYHEL